MTEIRFYQLKKHPLEQALPKLIEKVVSSGAKAVIMAESKERIAVLSSRMWTYDPGAFLAHGSAADGNPQLQPVWLTDADENPNAAQVLFLTDGAVSGTVAGYGLCCELFDGNDDAIVAAARDRWRGYLEAEYHLTYWQQNESGAWEKKAESNQPGANGQGG